MKYFSFEYDYAIQHPANLYTGAIIRKKTTKNTIYYMVRISHDVPILTQIDECEVPLINNEEGDYLLNLRTGAINIYVNGKATPVPVGGIEKEHELEVVRNWAGVTQ